MQTKVMKDYSSSTNLTWVFLDAHEATYTNLTSFHVKHVGGARIGGGKVVVFKCVSHLFLFLVYLMPSIFLVGDSARVRLLHISLLII